MDFTPGHSHNSVSHQHTSQIQQSIQKANNHFLREYNRLLVLNHVREYGPLARTQIARQTGLSRASVTTLIDTLLQEGLLHEGARLNSTALGGRRAMLVHFYADAGYIIGIDVGRTHLTLLLTNLTAKIIAQQTEAFIMQDGPEKCIPQLLASIRSFVADNAISWSHIIGMGLGIPGPLDPQLHSLSNPPGMPTWDQVNIWQALQQSFPVPLYLDNDANMAALGENCYGCETSSTSMVYLKVGTGIGAGLIMNGHIYHGRSGNAGELGHITIDENGPLCSCGNRGCLETFAGAQAIIHDARQALSLAQENTQIVSTPTIHLLDSSDTAHITIADVIDAAHHGDAACLAALKHAGERIGIALAGLINLLNPSLIIVGGSVAQAGDIFFQPLCRTAASRSLPAAWKDTRIQIGHLDHLAIALGAVSLVITTTFRMPAIPTKNDDNQEEYIKKHKCC